jgi:hypothetical protein
MFMMKKFKKVMSLALASIMTLSMCAVSALSAGAVDAKDYSKLPVTKKLVVNSEKTVVPEATFEFEMNPVAAADLKDSSGNPLKDTNGTVIQVGPDLADNTLDITFNEDNTAADDAGELTMTNADTLKYDYFDLTKFDGKFNNTGVYRYEVTETGSLVNDEIKNISYITYDETTYYVDLYVVQNDKGEYVVNSYVLTKVDADGTETAKPDSVTFKNKYNCSDINIYKTVEGTEYQQGEYYNFKILIPVGGKTIDLVDGSYFLAKIIDSAGSAVKDDRVDENGYLKLYVRGDTIDSPMTEGTAFKLKAGEHLQILDVPTTMIYKVEEDKDTAAAEGYTVTYNYDEEGGISTSTMGNKTNQSGCTVQGTVNSSKNTVTFKNTRNITPNTGLSFDVLPYALIVLVAACGGVLLIIKKKINAQ